MQLSIRLVFVSLVITCVAVTSFTSLYLSIQAAGEALADTKAVRDSSIEKCFVGAESNMDTMAEDVVKVAESSVVGLCVAYFSKFEKMVDKYLLMQEQGVPGADTPQEVIAHARPSMWKDVYDARDEGMSVLAQSTTDGALQQYVMSLETGDTIFTDYQEAGWNYSIAGPSTFTELQGSSPTPTLPPCSDNVYTTDLVHQCTKPFVNTPAGIALLMSALNRVGQGKATWGSLYSTPAAVTFTLFGSYHTRPPTSFPGGSVYIGISLRKLQEFLRTVSVGEESRLFMTMATDKVGGFTGMSYEKALTAASHGNVWRNDGENDRMVPIYPSESTDDVVRELGGSLEVVREVDGSNVTGFEEHSNDTTVMQTAVNATEGEKHYYYKVTRLQPGEGFDWHLTVAIERGHLLSATDELSLAVRQDIARSTSTVDDDIRRAEVILYASVAGVLAALTALSVVFVLWVIKPLLALQRDMHAVATLRLENVQLASGDLSSLSEVRNMQLSFYEMYKNIKEYKSYMPASLFMRVTNDEDEDDEKSFNKDTTASHTSEQSSVDGSRVLSNGTTAVSSDGVARALGVGDLRSRPVTYAVVNYVNFLATPRVHEDYLSEVLNMCKTHSGLPDSFSGDKVHLSWNAVRQVPDGMHQAVSMVWQIRATREGSVTFGVAGASVKCGNMGCATMKRYTFLGGVVQCASLLERLNKRYRSTVLVAGVGGTLRHRVQAKVVDSLQYHKYSKTAFEIVETMAPIEVMEEEWMYQLEGSVRNNPYQAYNSAFSAYQSLDYAGAAASMLLCTVSDPQLEYFRERVAKKEQLPPSLPFEFY